jgi:hypothetical protein
MAKLSARQVILRTYDRFFAEFLGHQSPVRLTSFPGCLPVSDYGTDRTHIILETFLGKTLYQILPCGNFCVAWIRY